MVYGLWFYGLWQESELLTRNGTRFRFGALSSR
jgi:hypothetical protein